MFIESFFEKVLVNGHKYYKGEIFKKKNKFDLIDLLWKIKNHCDGISFPEMIKFLERVNLEYEEIVMSLFSFYLEKKIIDLLKSDEDIVQKNHKVYSILQVFDMEIDNKQIAVEYNNSLTDFSKINAEEVIYISSILDNDKLNLHNIYKIIILSKYDRVDLIKDLFCQLSNKGKNSLIQIINNDMFILDSISIYINVTAFFCDNYEYSVKSVDREFRELIQVSFLRISNLCNSLGYLKLVEYVSGSKNDILDNKFSKTLNASAKTLKIFEEYVARDDTNALNKIYLTIAKIYKNNKHVYNSDFKTKFFDTMGKYNLFEKLDNFKIIDLEKADFINIDIYFSNGFEYLRYVLKNNTSEECYKKIDKTIKLIEKKFREYHFLTNKSVSEIDDFLRSKRTDSHIKKCIRYFCEDQNTCVILYNNKLLTKTLLFSDEIYETIYSTPRGQIGLKNTGCFLKKEDEENFNNIFHNMSKLINETEKLLNENDQDLNKFFIEHNKFKRLDAYRSGFLMRCVTK